MGELQVGNRVRWSSQAGGNVRIKIGTIVQVVDAGSEPSHDKLADYIVEFDRGRSRKERSYVVEVPGATKKSRPHVYWPPPQKLSRVRTRPSKKAKKPDKPDKPPLVLAPPPPNKPGPGGPSVTEGGPVMSKGLKNDSIYETPKVLIDAVVERFGEIVFDLAAAPENTKAAKFFTTQQDSLRQNWSEIKGLCWLNPPFTFIRPWVKKCVHEAERGANIVALTPASVGSRWFQIHVIGKADVYFLSSRITFKSHTTAYPKDCMIIHFHPDQTGRMECWSWEKKKHRFDRKVAEVAGQQAIPYEESERS